jgi:phosphatidylserine/phosphatidylglycerophosphate/cardiolipin synthase-like enzyme
MTTLFKQGRVVNGGSVTDWSDSARDLLDKATRVANSVKQYRLVRTEMPPGDLQDVTSRVGKRIGFRTLAEHGAKIFHASNGTFFVQGREGTWYRVVGREAQAPGHPNKSSFLKSIPKGLTKHERQDFVMAALMTEFARRGVSPQAGNEHQAFGAIRDIERSPGLEAFIGNALTAALLAQKRHHGLPEQLSDAERVVVSARTLRAATSLRTEADMHDSPKYPSWHHLSDTISQSVTASGIAQTPVTSPEFMERLAGLAGSIVTRGNKTTVIGDNAAELLLHEKLFLDPQTHSIHLSNWKIHADAVGRRELELLARKKRLDPSADIVVIVDGNIAANDLPVNQMLQSFSSRTGIPVVYSSDGALGMHEKKIVINGATSNAKVIMSDRNMGDEYLVSDPAKGWLGTAMFIEGPAARVAENDFRKLLNHAASLQAAAGKEGVVTLPLLDGDPMALVSYRGQDSVVMHSDIPGPENAEHFGKVLTGILDAARAGRDIIRLDQGYLMDVPGVGPALRRAAHRGVDIELLTNSRKSNDVTLITGPSLEFMQSLSLYPNVHVRVRVGTTDHRKIGTVTDLQTGEGVAFGGSGNLHGRSFYYEVETGAVVQGKDAVDQMNQTFGAVYGNDAQSERLGVVEPMNVYERFWYDMMKRFY